LGHSLTNAQHYSDKINGLQTYFDNQNMIKNSVFFYEFDDFSDETELKKFWLTIQSNHPGMKGIFFTNSRAYKIVNLMSENDFKKYNIIGFDMIDPNIKLLKENKIDFIINQNPILQGYLGIMNFVNHFILKKEIRPTQYLPLDIVLKEIVDFLKSPKKFLDIGARIPKGVMLTGAPGTGKTLLARAVAGEASVPFFHLSGSEFVEMFVGVGASRVRDLFKMAKKAAPAIIFVDEIDAIGRTRGGGFGGGNDEREQTLNQILVEMDGFEPNDKVIVMAATNRPDVLDPALVRPGRFDRKVILDLPDRTDREEILKIHALKKPLAEDINFKLIAERTPGFSGADLYSVMNEGAILAARENRKKVFQFDLIRAIEKVMLGPERKSHLLSKKEKEITAYHEGGHALVASVLPYADPVHKVSIIARGSAGGYTLKLPLEERKLQSKKEFIDDIAMSLGGYVAEKMVFGDITTGPSSDLQVASNLARAMVTRWGMSDLLGPVAFTDGSSRGPWGEGGKDDAYSENVAQKIDAEVSRIIHDGLASAEKVLTEYRKVLDAIAKKLMEVETLEQEEYEKIISAHGIVLKKKEIPATLEVAS